MLRKHFAESVAPSSCAFDGCEISASLKACGRCRLVLYCSPEHQKAAWKTHKLTCMAQPITAATPPVESLDEAQSSIDADDDDSSGWQPSRALLEQRARATELGADYVLIGPGRLPDISVHLEHVMGKIFFQLCKNRAFNTGSRKAVTAMFNMLKGQGGHITEKQIRQQLELEYGKF